MYVQIAGGGASRAFVRRTYRGTTVRGALVIAGNWTILITSVLARRRGARHISMIPVIGGVLVFGACIGLAIGPKLGVLALVLDPACVGMVVAALLLRARHPARDARRH